jgi:hypothetical protein
MQAVIFCAFFLLVDLFGSADFAVFIGNGVIHVNKGGMKLSGDLQCKDIFFTVPYTPNLKLVNQ